MNLRKTKEKNGITLIALVITIIIMLILAGISLNATIGDNGIIAKAQLASQVSGMAVVEEFLQQFYFEHYDEFESAENKVEALANYYQSRNWFYRTSTGYIIDGNGKKHYLLVIENLPEEIKKSIVYGTSEGKSIADFIKGNDVYGVSSELKLYYSPANFENMLGISYDLIEDEDNNKEIFSESSPWAGLVTEEGESSSAITLKDIRNITTLTIDENSGINSFSQLYNFTSLKYLTIKNISISLSGIENVPDLIYLYLDNVSISDYSSISKLTKLKWLYVQRNGTSEVQDNDEVKRMLISMKGTDYSQLKYFGIFGYSLVNISDLSNTTYDNTKISNVSDFSDLSNLSTATKESIRYLYINNNKITDFSPLADFKNLYMIRAENNPTGNLNYLANVKGIRYLTAINCSLSDISTLNNTFRNLYFLDLRNNPALSVVDNLSAITTIEYLYLSGCSGLTNTTVANIADYYNALKNKSIDSKYTEYMMGSTKRIYNSKNLTDTSDEITAMQNMSAENKLKVKKIALKDNSSLTDTKLNNLLKSGFTNVVSLDLRGCSLLTNLDFLENMPNLTELLIADTGVVGDEVKEIDDHCTKITCVNINTNVNLSAMQKTISKCSTSSTNAAWQENYWSGFRISANLIPQLANCTEITRFTTYGMLGSYTEGVVDLTNCTKMTSASLLGNSTKFKLPASVTSVSFQNAKIPDFSACANTIKSLSFNQNSYNTATADFMAMCQQLGNSTSLESISMTPSVDYDFSALNYLSGSNINQINITRNGGYNGEFTNATKFDFNKGEDFVEGSKHFDNLKTLYLDHAIVKDLNFLKDCTKLTSITITNSKIEDITALENIPNLQTLNLEYNKVTSLNAIKNSNKLTTLNLNYNSIYTTIYDSEVNGYVNNMEILKNLNTKALRKLYLSNNKIDDFSILNTLNLVEKLW